MLLFRTDHAGLYKQPQTPRLQAQLSLIPFVLLVLAEKGMEVYIVEFMRGGSCGVPTMAASTEQLRVRDLAKKRRCSKANRFVSSASSGSPPVAGVDLADRKSVV